MVSAYCLFLALIVIDHKVDICIVCLYCIASIFQWYTSKTTSSLQLCPGYSHMIFSVRCNIYISRLCYDVSVRLSVRLFVTEVHWRIIANLGFKFRSKFTMRARTRSACGRALWLTVHAGALWSRCMPGRGEGSSRAMLATARPLVCMIFQGWGSIPLP